MLVVRGVNFFPSAVENLVRRMPGTTGEHLIVLDHEVTDRDTGYLTGIKIRLECDDTNAAGVREQLARTVRSELTVRTLVEVVPPGTLQRSTHKSKRVVREL
jgi:phenylacetate-CoA ligase